MKLACKASLIAALCLMLWPAIAAAAPPTPKGKLVFEDDFSSKKSGLEDKLTATDYSRGFHAPGVYHLKDVKEKTTNWELFPNQSYGQFSYQADVWDNSDDVSAGDIAEGLVFRATDENHFYAALVDPRKGTYTVRKLNGKDSWSDIVAATDSAAIKRKADVNQVRVDGDGSKFTLYVNGEKLADSSYAKGGVGFIASNVDASANHIHFDNVKIYSAETASAPISLPKTGAPGELAPPAVILGVALLLLGLGAWMRRRTAA
jgi:acid stress-induced BolA-like protein IbaG/YrbA